MENVTCTFTNTRQTHLHLIKTVTNDNGGTALVARDWTLKATGTGLTPTNLSGTTPVTLGTGFSADTYTLSEVNGPAHYTAGNWAAS